MRVQGRHIHFVGVGGIGMSAIAAMALDQGAVVSGCDAREGPSTRSLAKRDCRIHIGHDPGHLEGVDLVVRSSAIPESAPEIRAARERGIRVDSRAQMLARFARGHRVVAVAGAHGKTTTTWLCAKLLIEAGCDPSVMVGGIVAELGGNYRLGTGDLFVAEIDESDGSLLEFQPHFSIVTNIDLEHVDHYPDLDAVKATFRRYIRRTRPEGCLIVCSDDANARDTRDAWPVSHVTYGLEAGADVRGLAVRPNGGSSTFDVQYPGGELRDLTIHLPGLHNVQNALAGVALACQLGIGEQALRRAFGQLRGVARRLEEKGVAGDIQFLDDYAHHPTEIRAALAAARGLVGGRLIGVFQPHRYSRTRHLGRRFATCFDALDHLVVLPIYGAGEQPIEGVSAEIITRAVGEEGRVECAGVEDWAAAHDRLVGLLRPGDALLTMGAGNVYQLGEAVLADVKERASL